MASATGEPAQPPRGALRGLDDAEAALVALRRSQPGRPTLGDRHDAALLRAIAPLPTDAAPAVRALGRRLACEVYARRYAEDYLSRAVELLSRDLHATGAGSLRVVSAFHREALVEHTPSAEVSTWDPAVRAAAVEGILEGFLAETFNCATHVSSAAGSRYQVRLAEGRDVNDGKVR